MFAKRTNVWKPHGRGRIRNADYILVEHPAVFPDTLASDHIYSWSNPDDLVYDPFAGSGTTLAMARELGRRYVGSEINPAYERIIRARLVAHSASLGFVE